MYDFHLRIDLREEANRLGYKDLTVVGQFIDSKNQKGLKDKAKSANADYTLYIAKNAEVARKCSADLLCLDFNKLVFDMVIGKSVEFVEFDFHTLLFSDSMIRAVNNFRKALKIARKCKNKILVSTRAEDVYQLRSPKDLESLLVVLGMTQEEANAAIVKNPVEFLKKVKSKKGMIRPGVKDES